MEPTRFIEALHCYRQESWRKQMEQIVKIHIEKLPEGLYLATSDEVQGLIAQGRTITETLEIARDVAKKLLEAQSERQGEIRLSAADDCFDYPLIVSG
jgi:predicted RNase H-like HicB family nuclease